MSSQSSCKYVEVQTEVESNDAQTHGDDDHSRNSYEVFARTLCRGILVDLAKMVRWDEGIFGENLKHWRSWMKHLSAAAAMAQVARRDGVKCLSQPHLP